MRDSWSYKRAKTYDRQRTRWHFVVRSFEVAKGEDEPREIYFRDDEQTTFGMLRFESVKNIPYRDFAAITNKIMNNKPFRTSLIDAETASVWSKGWK